MRVGISLLTLVPGRIGGSETYARELARALGRVGTCDYTALVSTLAAHDDLGVRIEVGTEYRAATTDIGRLATMTSTALRSRRLRRRLADLDVVHFPLTLPLPSGIRPRVITLHDVQHLDLPAMFSRAERAFRRVAYDRAARRADAVIAISSYGRERAIEKLGLSPDRVYAIPLGVDHARFHLGDTELREPFILYPARGWPHKNHTRLLAAFALIRSEKPDLRLVLTGGGLEGLPESPGVEVRGAVGNDELAALYRRASCLVFPSLYEGFGLPPLEAMACGCPVAASWAAALPETCGYAAVLFDPLDPQAIAAGVLDALSRAAELAAKGLARAAEFTWDATARAHEKVYCRLGSA